MSFGVWTQLHRNGLCALNDILTDSNILRQVINSNLPAPLNLITIVEVPIALTQLAGFYYCLKSGSIGMVESIFELHRLKKCLIILEELSFSGHDPENLAGAHTILRHEFMKNLTSFQNRFINSMSEFFIGITIGLFFFNTIHLHGVNHPKLVVDSVILLEIFIGVILISMVNNQIQSFQFYNRCQDLINIIKKEKYLPNNLYLFRCGLKAFSNNYSDLVLLFFPKFKYHYKKTGKLNPVDEIKTDIENLRNLLNGKIDENMITDDDDIFNTDLTLSSDFMLNLLKEKKLVFISIIYNFLFFFINMFAGFGFLQNILVYYFPMKVYPMSTYLGTLSWSLMFSKLPDYAVWYGNFIGEILWTIEPILVITRPFIISLVLKYQRKSTNKFYNMGKSKLE